MQNTKEKYIYSLTLQAIEGRISEKNFSRLEEHLQESSRNRQIYSDLNIMYSYMRRPALTFGDEIELEDHDLSFDPDLWNQLATYEAKAPTITISKEEPQRELIQKVVYPPKKEHKLSKFNIFTFVMSTAAVLFFALFLRFFTPQRGVEVATLADSVNAVWSDDAGSIEKGTRIATRSGEMVLHEGLIELLFDNNAKVVVEGPAGFELISEDQINMNFGRIYATVPHEAIGFIINTPTSRVIDLGTEFGVEADAFGNSYLHVIKGKTTLIAGEKDNKVIMEVDKGNAKKVSAVTSEVSDITCNDRLFVRDLDSKAGFVWKGQTVLMLTDIIEGGNGFGTGISEMGIHPLTGSPSKTIYNHDGAASNIYHVVRSNPFVDGVFIPNGQTNQIISSRGHLFRECPVTSGDWYSVFQGVMRPESKDPDSPYVRFLVQHANMGITYDLQAIRSFLPDVKITRFRTKCGVGMQADRQCNADFWVLVDGELRYKKTQVQEKKQFYPIDIELSETDRFLTIVTTDGQDPKGRVFDKVCLLTIDSDWCMFVEPVLVLE